MATSLENCGNMNGIPNHNNPTLAAHILNLWCIGPELCSILCNFDSDIQNFVAMATSLQKIVTELKSTTTETSH